MWWFETRKAKESDYRLRILPSIVIVLPSPSESRRDSLNTAFTSTNEYFKIQCIRRKIEAFFSVPQCIRYISDSSDQRIASEAEQMPWVICEASHSEHQLTNIKMILPKDHCGMFFRTVVNVSNVLFLNSIDHANLHGGNLPQTPLMFSVLHRPIANSPGFNSMNSVTVSVLSENNSNVSSIAHNGAPQLRCLQRRRLSSNYSLLVHDAFLSRSQFSQLIHNSVFHSGALAPSHSVVIVSASCAGFMSFASSSTSSESSCSLMPDGITQLASCAASVVSHVCQQLPPSHAVVLALRDVHLSSSLAALHSSMQETLLAQLSRSRYEALPVIYLVGDVSLSHEPAANQRNMEHGRRTSEDRRTEPVLSASSLLFRSGNSGDTTFNDNGETMRLLTEMSLYIASPPSMRHSGGEEVVGTSAGYAEGVAGAEMEAMSASVTGLPQLLHALEQRICWPTLLSPLYERLEHYHPSDATTRDVVEEHGVTGVLVTGRVGSGKTHLSTCLSKILRRRLLTPSLADVISGLVGGTEENLRRVFTEAKRLQPCILVLEHFNSLLGNDVDADSGSQAPAQSHSGFMASLLACIDDVRRYNALLQSQQQSATSAGSSSASPSGVLVLLLVRSSATPPDGTDPLEKVRILLRPDRLAVHIDLDTLLAASGDGETGSGAAASSVSSHSSISSTCHFSAPMSPCELLLTAKRRKRQELIANHLKLQQQQQQQSQAT